MNVASGTCPRFRRDAKGQRNQTGIFGGRGTCRAACREAEAQKPSKIHCAMPVAAETSGMPWNKLRLLTPGDRRKCRTQGTFIFTCPNLGVFRMSFRLKAVAAAALSLATLATGGLAQAADLPVKAAKKAADLPFFLVIDDRVSFSYIFKATEPGMWSLKPDGTINGKTAKQVYSFTHFDLWAYGTNFFTISMFKSDHNDPASPCTNAGRALTGGVRRTAPAQPKSTACSARPSAGTSCSTPRPSRMGPLHNISFEVGMDANTENNFFGAGQARRRRRSPVRLRPSLQGLFQRLSVDVLGVLQPQRLHAVRPVRLQARRRDL